MTMASVVPEEKDATTVTSLDSIAKVSIASGQLQATASADTATEEDNSFDFLTSEKTPKRVAAKMAGEIVLSDNPGKTIRKWRDIFKVSQKELAVAMRISPSVISDYESGRRKSPGISAVRKIVETIIKLDESRGSKVISEFESMLGGKSILEAILDLKEFNRPLKASEMVKAVKGTVVSGSNYMDRDVFGYTIVDSVRAIIEFGPLELIKIYGSTSQRAIIFTRVGSGRSPMIAIKLTSLKPAMVILHKPVEVDRIAIKIAESERIPLVTTGFENVDELMEALRKKMQ